MDLLKELMTKWVMEDGMVPCWEGM